VLNCVVFFLVVKQNRARKDKHRKEQHKQ